MCTDSSSSSNPLSGDYLRRGWQERQHTLTQGSLSRGVLHDLCQHQGSSLLKDFLCLCFTAVCRRVDFFFSFLPQDARALHNSVFPLKLWMFLRAQMQLPPSWGCFLWHLCPESLLGSGTHWGANTRNVPKRGGEIKGIHTARTGRWADAACGCCLFVTVPNSAPWGQESVCRTGTARETSLLDLCCWQSTV